ncbi:class II histone deacetylase [Aeromicrobium sp.]|uniref:class II histone deacetylase n=1 Tax=Aeromicrobium sp. TaxID=1871063 RepID=UPI0028AAD9C2|nr:class II histone deacetylase [Aeromicrobium sp.]
MTAGTASRTGWVWHELYGWHDTGRAAGYVLGAPGVQPFAHFESAESKTRFASLVEVSGLREQLTEIRPRAASVEDLLRVHDAAHVDRIREESRRQHGGDMGDGSSPFGWNGYEVGALAAGGAIEAVRAVADGSVDNAYALVRPPGHHAVRESGMGFCMFANVAVAIEAVRASHGLERFAVIDWDVHHGNGTEAIYADDPDVLTVSIHQDRNYPIDTGDAGVHGAGAAAGSIVNVALPPGSGNGAYRAAFERVVLPSVAAFKPDMIIVACGYDASAADPLSAMMLTSSTYREMTRSLVELAGAVCGGRLAMSHEGGYSPVYVPFCGLAVVEALSGIDSGIADPYEADWAAWAGQELQPHQGRVIELVRGQLSLSTE